MDHTSQLNQEIRREEKEWFNRMMSRLPFVTKQDIEELKKEIKVMASKIETWAAQEQADLTAIKSTLDGIATGIANLDAAITAFQNSPGTLSAADQAALDGIQSQVAALKAQSAAIKTDAPAPTPPAP